MTRSFPVNGGDARAEPPHDPVLVVGTPAEMDAHVGRRLGTGAWLTVTQAMIDAFAAVTGDDQWIHVDVARAARELPGGTTIAHGYLTLSLLPRLGRSVFAISGKSRALNYGSNKVRFTGSVPAGSRIRAVQSLKASEPVPGGRRLVLDTVVEVEGQDRPALVAETIVQAYG